MVHLLAKHPRRYYNKKEKKTDLGKEQKEVSAMAQDSGFFSRLRKGKQPKAGPDSPVKPSAPSGEPVHNETVLPPEPQEEAVVISAELNFPVTHTLNQLWQMYAEVAETPSPPPELTLEPAMEPLEPGVEGAAPVYLLTREELPPELDKLRRTVTSATDRRFVKQKTLDGREAPDMDAEIVVYLGPRSLTAWFLILPPSGAGEHVDSNMIRLALDSFKINTGVNEELTRSLPERPDRYFRLFLVAQGVPPVDGKDGFVVDRFSRKPTRALQEDENGCVDFTSSDLFQSAAEGAEICEIHAPTPCQNGLSVQGYAVPARPGKAPVIPKGRNTELNEDGTLLIASRAGHVEFSGRAFQIRPVLEINSNVDYSTGNIKSLGDIHITGDVLSGFTVISAGNVTIDGVVEACNIEAGGDLVIRSGVQGNSTAVLRAHGNIFARFLESANVYVGQDLDAECIINCNIYCDGAVKVRSDRGSIIGGVTHAAREVSATIIGARSEVPTSVVLGGTPCEDFERDSLQMEIEDLEKEMERLFRQPDSPAKNRLLAKAKVQIMANKMKLETFEDESAKDEPETPSHTGRMVTTMMFPGVEITFGNLTTRVTREHGMCTVSLVKGEILIA